MLGKYCFINLCVSPIYEAGQKDSQVHSYNENLQSTFLKMLKCNFAMFLIWQGSRLSSLMVHFLNGPLPQFLNGPLSGQVKFWYTCSAHYTRRSQLQNGQTKMKNECRFEIFILKGVVLGRYIF